MNPPQLGLKIASVLVGLCGLAHRQCLLAPIQISLAGYDLPLWFNVLIILVVGSLLTYWLRPLAVTK